MNGDNPYLNFKALLRQSNGLELQIRNLQQKRLVASSVFDRCYRRHSLAAFNTAIAETDLAHAH